MLPLLNSARPKSVLRSTREERKGPPGSVKQSLTFIEDAIYERLPENEGIRLQLSSMSDIHSKGEKFNVEENDRNSQLDKAKRFFQQKAQAEIADPRILLNSNGVHANFAGLPTNAALMKVPIQTNLGTQSQESQVFGKSDIGVPLKDKECHLSPHSKNQPQKARPSQAFEIFSRKEHGAVINKCTFSPDSSLLLTASGDSTCRIFRRSIETDTDGYYHWIEAAVLKGHKWGTWSVSMSTNNEFCVTSGGDETVRLWTIATKIPPEIDAVEIRKILGKLGERTTGTRKEIYDRLKKLLSADEDEAKRSKIGDEQTPIQTAWRCVYIISKEGKGGLPPPFSVKSPIFDCALHPSNALLATGWCDGTTRIYYGLRKGSATTEDGFAHSAWSWDCVQTMNDHEESVFRCVFSQPGDILTTVSRDQSVMLYSVSSQGTTMLQRLKSLKGHMGPVLGISHHPSGRLMATCSCDTNSVIWFLANLNEPEQQWAPIGMLQGHRHHVKACSFREDGMLLATASRDRTVRLWGTIKNPREISQMRKFPCLEILRCHDEVCSVQFGTGMCMALLVAATSGGLVFMWDTDKTLGCENPVRVEAASAEVFNLFSRPEDTQQGDILFQDDGRRMPDRPQTALSDWSRMQTPNQASPSLHSMPKKTAPVSQFEPTIYGDLSDGDDDSHRFNTMDPHGEYESATSTRRIKDYTAQLRHARAQFAVTTNTVTHDDVKKVLKIANLKFHEGQLDELVRMQPEAAIAILKMTHFTDTDSITSVVARLSKILSELNQKGLLHKKHPLLRRHRHGNMLLLGKKELEGLIGLRIATQKKVKEQHAIEPVRDRVEHKQMTKKDFTGNAKGDQLAVELSSKTLIQVKRIVGEQMVKLLTPELAWTQNGERLAGRVTIRILEWLDNAEERGIKLRHVCGLLSDLKALNETALEILDTMTTLPHKTQDSSFSGSLVDVSNLDSWSGVVDDLPTQASRLPCPLYASSNATTIGTVFDPDCGGRVSEFKIFVALATTRTRTTQEGKDHERSHSAGVSFKFIITEWDLSAETAGSVLHLSREHVVTDHCFRPFALEFGNTSGSPGFYRGSPLFLGLTTDGCHLCTKGAAWISGFGRLSEREMRRGVVMACPNPPAAVRDGTRIFAGSHGGEAKNRWARQEEMIACHIKYMATS